MIHLTSTTHTPTDPDKTHKRLWVTHCNKGEIRCTIQILFQKINSIFASVWFHSVNTKAASEDIRQHTQMATLSQICAATLLLLVANPACSDPR